MCARCAVVGVSVRDMALQEGETEVEEKPEANPQEKPEEPEPSEPPEAQNE